jgi:hypothetical protein
LKFPISRLSEAPKAREQFGAFSENNSTKTLIVSLIYLLIFYFMLSVVF